MKLFLIAMAFAGGLSSYDSNRPLDGDCPDGFTPVHYDCGTSICAKFPSSYSSQDRANWVFNNYDKYCGGPTKPDVPSLQPPS